VRPTVPVIAPGAGHPVLECVAGAFAARPGATARAVGWAAVGAIPAAVLGWAVAHALDDGFLAGDATRGLAWLAVPAAGTVLAAVVAARSVRAVGDIVEPFRDHLVDHVVSATLTDAVSTAAPRPGSGNVARLVQQIESVRLSFASGIATVLAIATTLLGSLAGEAKISPVALLVTLPPVLLALGLFALTLPAVLRRQRALVVGQDALSRTLETDLVGLRDIRAAGAQDWALADGGARIDAQNSAAGSAASITSLRLLVIGLGGRAPAVLFLLATPWLLRHGTSPGAVAGSLTYLIGTVQTTVQALADGLGSALIPMWVTLENLLGDRGPAEPDPGPALPHCRCDQGPAVPVRTRGLSFAYGPHAEPVLRELDLDVAAGEHVAVVGASGIGKSTLAGLICGQLIPGGGSVRVGAVDPAVLPPAERSLLRVLIPQEAYVFSASLGENLRYLRPDADDTALDAAVAAIGMARLRDRLGGYEAPVDPTALSGGERQLIALTRAWLSRAPLLVLDEATCHLDPVAEARAETAFAQRPGTLIVIAHRISSARRADRILVMDGTHATIGTDAQLMSTSPLYRDLVGHWQPVNGHQPAPAPAPAPAPISLSARDMARTPVLAGSPWRINL
jgi:ATP-binding cassette, subfamily B, bacterial RamB/AmfA